MHLHPRTRQLKCQYQRQNYGIKVAKFKYLLNTLFNYMFGQPMVVPFGKLHLNIGH